MAGRHATGCLLRASVVPVSRPSPLLSSSLLLTSSVSSSSSSSLLLSSRYGVSTPLRQYTTIEPSVDPPVSPSSSSSSSPSSSLPPKSPSEKAMLEKAEKMLGLAKENASVGKFEKALVILNGAAVLNPPDNQKSEIFLWTGYVHQCNSSFESALSFFEKGLGLSDNNEMKLWGMMNQAECLAKTGDINQAVEVVKNVLPLIEQHLGKDSEYYGTALGNLCAYLALCEGREDEAIEAGKEGFLLLKERVGLQNSLTTGIFQNLNRIVERTGRTDVFDNIEKELQKIESSPKLIFNHFEVVKRGGGGGKGAGRGGEWAGGEWRDKKRKLKGYLEEYLDEVAHEGVETKKFFDPRGLIRTKKLVKNQLDDFLATWKISGHFLDPRSEKLFEEMIERSIDDQPSSNEIDHVIDQAITTGELTKEQQRVLAMREEFRKKKEAKVPPPPAYEDEDLEDIQWLEGEESDELDFASEQQHLQQEENYFADEDETDQQQQQQQQEQQKEKKADGEVEDYYLDEYAEGEVVEEGFDDGGFVGEEIEMKRREVGGEGAGVEDLDGGFYDYEDDDEGYVSVDEDVLGDHNKE